MEASVNLVAVILAAISSLAIGSLWYSPLLFFKPWSQLAKISTDQQQSAVKSIAIAAMLSLVTAYAIAFLTYFVHRGQLGQHSGAGLSYFQVAMVVAIVTGLAMVVSRLFIHDGFEGRPTKLSLINAAHEMVAFALMGAIIGFLGY